VGLLHMLLLNRVNRRRVLLSWYRLNEGEEMVALWELGCDNREEE
jgi:hypothetical protein